MTDDYETRTFTLEPIGGSPSSYDIRRFLQPLGDEAWEITYVGSGRDRSDETFGPFVTSGGRWVEARRPRYGSPGPSSWEYTGFNTYDMPEPNWSAHLASCGWEKVSGIWYSYHMVDWHVFKRTDVWRGTDDGDIHRQLLRLGFAVNAGSLYAPRELADRKWQKPLRQVVKEILDAKWQLSAEAGHDVGTARAVEHWRSMQ
jgi:hypothetical protein